jgi:hypothetical protein
MTRGFEHPLPVLPSPTRPEAKATMKRPAILLFCALPALVLACGAPQPAPPPVDTAVVLPPPSAAISAEPSAAATAVPAPSAAPSAMVSAAPSSAPSASGAVDRLHCHPTLPAVSFEVKDDDVVVPLDASGCPLGESHFVFNGYSYKAAVAFFTDLQKQLKAGEKKAAAELMQYPLRVNGAKGAVLAINDKASFVKNFDRIFPASTIAAVLKEDPRDVAASSHGLMLGRGVLWGDVDKGNRYGITAINTP